METGSREFTNTCRRDRPFQKRHPNCPRKPAPPRITRHRQRPRHRHFPASRASPLACRLTQRSQNPSVFHCVERRGLLTKLCVSRTFFFMSPRSNPRKQIAGRSRNVFDFGYAAIARRFPNLSYDQRAVFSHDPAQMMHRCRRSGLADSVPRAARGERAVSSRHFTNSQRQKRVRSAI